MKAEDNVMISSQCENRPANPEFLIFENTLDESSEMQEGRNDETGTYRGANPREY